jgi:hypothetical protein
MTSVTRSSRQKVQVSIMETRSNSVGPRGSGAILTLCFVFVVTASCTHGGRQDVRPAITTPQMTPLG